MVACGAACMAAGVFLLSLLEAGSTYRELVPGMALLGVGMGLFYASVTTAAVQSIDPSRTSLAGGLVYMFQLAGGAIGLGVTTTIVAFVSRDRLNEELASLGTALTRAQALTLHGLLADTDAARALLATLPAAVADRVTSFAEIAFVAGIRIGLRVDGLLALAEVLVAALLIGKPVVHAGWHHRDAASSDTAPS